MLQAANTDLFNPLVPIAHNSVCQNLQFPFQINPAKMSAQASFADFYFLHPRHRWVKPAATKGAQASSKDIENRFSMSDFAQGPKWP